MGGDGPTVVVMGDDPGVIPAYPERRRAEPIKLDPRHGEPCTGVLTTVAGSPNLGDIKITLTSAEPQYLTFNSTASTAEPRPLQSGDVVKLKSGGPPMCVTGVRVHPAVAGIVDVTWFNGGHEHHCHGDAATGSPLTAAFPAACLELVK